MSFAEFLLALILAPFAIALVAFFIVVLIAFILDL